MKPPTYFSEIERRSRERWEQLEKDPDLAGPWHQLFRQVQSPRHVLSELLQNADDAGAKSASVRIQNGNFIFEHDGLDFNEEQFSSLCRFGFSNKRTLHTIGFRGVGFKSTFSLGDTVEVQTPTLAIQFKRARFTQPVWLASAVSSKRTIIRVRIADRNRAVEIQKNLEEWQESPASLLFFNNLRELVIDGNSIRTECLGDGPVPNSTWLRLDGADTEKILMIRSEPAQLPEEAVREIHAERGVDPEALHLPPCRLEVVLGLSATQRLYVVLPTGATLDVPFSCNGPFIQDPSRFAIKHPATSPTNRWLLERAGELVAQAMLHWLENDLLSPKERAAAYGFLRKATEFSADLEGVCSRMIMDRTLGALSDKRVLLTAEGKLVKQGACVAVPTDLHSVWRPEQLIELFGANSDHLLALVVPDVARKTLASHNWLKVIDEESVLRRLEEDDVPRPGSWPQLHMLWSFVQNKVGYDWNKTRRRSMQIVPVEGKLRLSSAASVVRLSSKRDLLSQSDWRFVMDHALTVEPDWLEWISSLASKKSASAHNYDMDPGYCLLQDLGLHEPSSVDRIVAQASLRIFRGKDTSVADCVRIAHIMAALNATVPPGFRYVTKDLFLREPDWGIVADDTGRTQDLVPVTWANEHVLHEDYYRDFNSCKPDAWRIWIQSEKSGLLNFVPIAQQQRTFYRRDSVTLFVTERGAQPPKEFHYKRDHFTLTDFGFDPELVKFWEKRLQADPSIWAGVMDGILSSPPYEWESKTEAEVRHEGTTYHKMLDCGFIPSKWIVHFRSVACLPDAHGKLHVPAELFLRTPDTEPLMGVEPFVRSELDTERTKPLLKLLGVRDTPTGADKLLARLRALSAVHPLRLADIFRIYEALDRIVARCSPAELHTIKEAFSQKDLILTEGQDWMTAQEVSIFSDDTEDSPTIHHTVQSLAMWPRLGVSERPSVERAIDWLKSLGSGVRLEGSILKRARSALQRTPVRLWNETGHWLSLDSTWEPVANLRFRLTMQGLMKWGELTPSIKRATANLTGLPVETTQMMPFSQVRDLGDAVEFRVTRVVGNDGEHPLKEWLVELASGLCRVKLSVGEDTGRVRSVARRLRGTRWHTFSTLGVTPYVDGVPSGEPFTPKTLWQEHILYVGNFSSARIHKELTDELSRPFALESITQAIAACIDRSCEFVAEYLNSHFDLDPNLSLPGLEGEKTTPPESPQVGHNQPNEHEEGDDTQSTEPEPASTDGPTEKATEDGGSGTEPKTDKPKPPVQREPTLIDRYARQRGFRWHERERCYAHPDGRWIQKSESPFNWEEHAGDGSVIRRLWVSDQKLSTGIEIAAELWSLISQKPGETGVVVAGDNHVPLSLAGQELLERKRSEQITLYPSRYRIVEENKNS